MKVLVILESLANATRAALLYMVHTFQQRGEWVCNVTVPASFVLLIHCSSLNQIVKFFNDAYQAHKT